MQETKSQRLENSKTSEGGSPDPSPTPNFHFLSTFQLGSFSPCPPERSENYLFRAISYATGNHQPDSEDFVCFRSNFPLFFFLNPISVSFFGVDWTTLFGTTDFPVNTVIHVGLPLNSN